MEELKITSTPSNVRKHPNGGEPSICFDCEHAVFDCSWSKNFILVEGWVAIPSKVIKGGVQVISCPLFERTPDRESNGFLNDEENDLFLADYNRYLESYLNRRSKK